MNGVQPSSEKRELELQSMTEAYYGKKALIAEWEPYRDIDFDYVIGLERRVSTLYKRLVNRNAL